MSAGRAAALPKARQSKKRKPRMCSRFRCDKRVERKRDRCREPCLNDPDRCGLEDRRPKP